VSHSDDEAGRNSMGGSQCQLVRGLACFWLVVHTRMLMAVSPSNDKADGSFTGGPRCQLVCGVTCLWLVVRARELTVSCRATMMELTGAVLNTSWCVCVGGGGGGVPCFWLAVHSIS